MEDLLVLIDRLAGHLDSELFHEPLIYRRKHHRAMGLTAFQLRKSSSRRVFIRRRGNRERDEHLIRVQARILPAQIGRRVFDSLKMNKGPETASWRYFFVKLYRF